MFIQKTTYGSTYMESRNKCIAGHNVMGQRELIASICPSRNILHLPVHCQ